MVTPVVTVCEDTPIDDIAQLLERHRIKRVPVTGALLGIVSEGTSPARGCASARSGATGGWKR
jgi:CBS-domain-containing membrane protein